MNYQEEVLREAFNDAVGSRSESYTKKVAEGMAKYLADRGWRITRDDHTQEYVSEGPIQRALGLDGGDGF